MADDIQNYKLQLQQYEAALLTDPNNSELLKLRKDLVEAIELMRDPIKTQVEEQKKTSSSVKPNLFTLFSQAPHSGADQSSSLSLGNDIGFEAVSLGVERVTTTWPNWKIGDKCQAKCTEDGNFYDATIEGISESGVVSVVFDAFQSRSTTILGELKDRVVRNEVFPPPTNSRRHRPFPDGQDNIGPTAPQAIRSNSQFSSVPTQLLIPTLPPPHSTENQTYEIDDFEAISESDRNQYLVAGENAVDDPIITAPIAPQVIRSNSQFSSVQPQLPLPTIPSPHLTENQTYEIDDFVAISESDRNQYLVAGENAVDDPIVTAPAPIPPTVNIERVVTGLENVEKLDNALPTRQREVNMDGENVEDKQQQQQQQPPPQQSQRFVNAPKTLSQSDSIEDLDAPNNYSQKKDSNPSTDDESDREKYYNRGKGQANKRGDDRRKQRDDARYETEDTDHSIHERRRFKESDRYADKGRDMHRGRSVDIDENDSRTYRDRGEKQYRGDKHYRPPSRDDEDRYYSNRYGDSRSQRDRYRYETDDSHYDKDDSRYDRNRRRNDRDRVRERDNYGRYRDDRQHHKPKDYERQVRDDRDRNRGRDDRYSDYDKTRRDRARVRSGNGSERGDYPSGYYQPAIAQPFGYDPMASYLQNQHYYENLRRTNPVAYAEWYNRYFANQLAAASAVAAVASEHGRESGRESVHSGRSSSKDNDRSHQQLNSFEGMSRSLEPERLTPLKFTSTHSSASFQNGQLVCIKQKFLSSNEIQNNVHILKFALNNHTKRLYQAFPGPLSPVTHTKQVIDFCLEQVRSGPNAGSLSSRSTSNSMSSLQSVDQTNRASFSLLWNFLILLLRQRGVFVGSDISELLLKNKEEFPYEQQQQQLNSTKLSRENGDQLSDDELKDGSNDAFSNDSEQLSLSVKQVTEKFREFLLYGSINEALDWATDNNLWGHALFLASKVDRRSHANVMIKFANKLPLVDPLNTLYQLKSGRVPLSVTSSQDEKWGDWRPHLAMIISNPSPTNSEIDRKAIITMGDSLHNRGDLFAAQFCYLMAKVEFSKYSDVKHDAPMILNSTTNAVRLILLGASHSKSSFSDFVTDEAIIMTEIYEYACALANSQFSIVEFQPFKYLLGTRMLDYGFHLKSLLYMEQVALHIQKNPAGYERSFIEKVYNMADKLKYYDPVMEKNLDSISDDDGNTRGAENPL